MAKKTTSETTQKPAKKANSALAFMKALNKETGAESFAESKLTEIEHYISTGNYALNRIISGSIHKGIPAGILTVLAGDSASMKTVLACRVAANAIKENNYDCVIYVDSEGGANRGLMTNAGLDLDKVQYIPVSNIEECTIKLIQTYKTIEKYQQETDPNFRCLIILDSLGGLVSEKVLLDAEKDKTAGDLGGAAKKCLHPDTLVLMADGNYKMLKDINVGDSVVTHLGKIKPVVDKFTTNHKKLVTIKVAGKEIKCSTNHKFLIKRNNTLKFCEASKLKTTDKLVQFLK